MIATLLALLLFPALVLAATPQTFKVIVSHDDFLAALTCYGEGYKYFERLSKDNVMCIKGIDKLTEANARGAIDAKRYVLKHTRELRVRGAH